MKIRGLLTGNQAEVEEFHCLFGNDEVYVE
jgi:hypothetical protein